MLKDGYVTEENGTGIVHQAPAFGEDDYRVCLENGVIKRGEPLICPVDDNGRFTAEVGEELKGKPVKGKGKESADATICRSLKARGRLVLKEDYEHEYPFCWRSDTPLIYRAVPSWFVNVPAIKKRLVANNKKTYWVPEKIGTGRFNNWLESARDWAVSRNRYWGTPMPVWISEDGKQRVVVGSIEELKKLTGEKEMNDIHRDKIDHLTIPDPRGEGYPPLKRTPEVFDCWFESGSMPYGQLHYPFENKEEFEAKFPADFIAEGLDQTRGWFYTLMVISTALFDKPAFKNLIVNGLILAADGKKMSKRLKNYPPPTQLIDRQGADALRLYLINSPVVRAQEFRFNEDGVKGVVKEVFLPWYHSMRFLVENIRRFERARFKAGQKPFQFSPDPAIYDKTNNKMDRWILSRLDWLIGFVRQEMKLYHLYTVVPRLVTFIDDLTNTYVRFNRDRMKGATAETSLQTLYHVLLTLCRLMAPFTPFLVEKMYQTLKLALPESEREDSVHYLMLPEVVERKGVEEADFTVRSLASVVDLGRQLRTENSKKVPWKTPLSKAIVVNKDSKYTVAVKELETYALAELNCKKIELSNDLSKYATYSLWPNMRALGKQYGRKAPVIKRALMALDMEAILEFEAKGTVEVEGVEVKISEVDLQLNVNKDMVSDTMLAKSDGTTIIFLDFAMTDDLLTEGKAREVIQAINQLRKEAKLKPDDVVDIYYSTTDKPDSKVKLADAIARKGEFITTKIRAPMKPMAKIPLGSKVVASKSTDIGNATLKLSFIAQKQ